MAARLAPAGGVLPTRRDRRTLVGAALVAAALLAGCVPLTSAPSAGAPAVSLAPAQPDVAQTAGALEAAFRSANLGFIRAIQPYQPSEPLDVRSVPRTVYQVVLPQDPGAGYVVIYDAGTGAAANTAARSLAAYLASGFGQTNYPTDAQFAVDVYGPTVVFGWWSPGASTDRTTAAAAFRVLQRFGTPVPVVR